MENRYNYKVTYFNEPMMCAFVRISDDAVLYSSTNEQFVIDFANGFKEKFGYDYYIE